MSNTKENEDESAAQPVPTPLATDDPVIADGKLESVEQLDHASQQPLTDPSHNPNPNPNPSSSPAPEPIDKDKLLLAEDENPALPTEAGSSNDIADLKSATEQSHQDSTSPALLPKDKSSLKPDTEPATDDKAEAILTPDSKSKALAGNGNETSDSEAFTCNETETPVSKISATDGTEISKPGTFIGDANGIDSSKSEMTAVNGTDLSDSKTSPGCGTETSNNLEVSKPSAKTKIEHSEVPENTSGQDVATVPKKHGGPATPLIGYSRIKAEVDNARQSNNDRRKVDLPTAKNNGNSSSKNSFLLDDNHDGNESGTEEEQLEFMKELDNFFREKKMEFKPPKFYGEGLNCLKLWRAVMKLGGYDKVTSCKLWRQVGESFKPPKTCTTVSWTFRGFYEKALLDYERHKISGGEVTIHVAPNPEPMIVDSQALGSGRARRDAAARAMQGWHEQRLVGHGEVSYPIIKDKNLGSSQKREKQIKSLGLLKRKQPSYMEDSVKTASTKSSKSQLRLDVEVVDIGSPADWVKINVLRTKECFEVYALVPGLLREEVRVQSDPAGRLVISGEPEHPDNPWGVTPFKKVVSLPCRIDPHQTSAVVTLHGQLLVRVPFEQSD